MVAIIFIRLIITVATAIINIRGMGIVIIIVVTIIVILIIATMVSIIGMADRRRRSYYDWCVLDSSRAPISIPLTNRTQKPSTTVALTTTITTISPFASTGTGGTLRHVGRPDGVAVGVAVPVGGRVLSRWTVGGNGTGSVALALALCGGRSGGSSGGAGDSSLDSFRLGCIVCRNKMNNILSVINL